MKIQHNDLVLLLAPDNKTYLLRVELEKEFHTNNGILKLDDAIGKEFGDSLVSTLDNTFLILEPTIEDRMMKVKRQTQIIYPKDASMILLKASIGAGSRVIETGLGSGALSIVLANAVAPNGKLYTYERRKEFIKNARKNIERVIRVKLRKRTSP